MRTPRWRRWASSLPVIVALLFATTTVAATAEPTASATGAGHVPMVVQAVSASAPQPAGQRPDIPVVQRGGSWASAVDLGALAWVSARAGTVPAGWWHRRQDVDRHRAQARRENHQDRGPPGRRAPHVPS